MSNNKPIKIWLADLTHTQQTIASDSMPLGIAALATYGQKQLGEKVEFRLFKYPEKLIQAFLTEEKPDLIGFSNYIWNLDLSYSIAERMKREKPDLAVVFGGPNYPLDDSVQKDFLTKRPAIDFYIFGEGEKPFADLIAALIDNDFSAAKVKPLKINNCHCLIDGELVKGETAKKIDINEVPSPYLAGLMDEFFDGKLMPLIQTTRGCPFSCLYCGEGHQYYNEVCFRDLAEVEKEVAYIAQRSKDNKKLFIADSNFGMYDHDLDVANIIGRAQDQYGYPEYIHVAAGKNNKEKVLVAARATHGAFRLSASVQSTDAEVLKNIRRQNISWEDALKLAQEAREVGSNTYAEIILALPGDSKEAFFQSVKDMINIDLNYLRIWTLMMLQGSDLTRPATREQFGLINKFRVMPRCFGTYQFGSEKFHSIEVEEVCVANQTLSFADYLACREFCLTVEIFYNDGILAELTAFLRQYQIYPFDLLQKIQERRPTFSATLTQIYDGFVKETAAELWESREELENFAKTEENIKKYLSGELGSNLIFKYKSLTFLQCIKEIHDLAFGLAQELLKEKIDLDQSAEIFEFLAELKKFSFYQKDNMIDTNQIYHDQFIFDWLKIKDRDFKVRPAEFKLSLPQAIVFKHNDQQVDIISRHKKEFGSDLVGMSRIFSRIYTKKMYRQIQFLDQD